VPGTLTLPNQRVFIKEIEKNGIYNKRRHLRAASLFCKNEERRTVSAELKERDDVLLFWRVKSRFKLVWNLPLHATDWLTVLVEVALLLTKISWKKSDFDQSSVRESR
jgi:hypothetical protein